jgi:hypothetical protein
MEMFVNTAGVPVNNTKPQQDGRIVGGTKTHITSYPYQVWNLVCCPIWRYVWDIWTNQTACVCDDNFLVVKTY